MYKKKHKNTKKIQYIKRIIFMCYKHFEERLNKWLVFSPSMTRHEQELYCGITRFTEFICLLIYLFYKRRSDFSAPATPACHLIIKI